MLIASQTAAGVVVEEIALGEFDQRSFGLLAIELCETVPNSVSPL